jgi:hypothetical protein
MQRFAFLVNPYLLPRRFRHALYKLANYLIRQRFLQGRRTIASASATCKGVQAKI